MGLIMGILFGGGLATRRLEGTLTLLEQRVVAAESVTVAPQAAATTCQAGAEDDDMMKISPLAETYKMPRAVPAMLFTPEECERIIRWARRNPLREGKVLNTMSQTTDPTNKAKHVGENAEFRRSQFTGLYREDPEIQWVYDRILNRIVLANTAM